MVEVHSTYQWKLSEPDDIYVIDIEEGDDVGEDEKEVTATVKITNTDNVFAIIDGTYLMKINVHYTIKGDSGEDVTEDTEDIDFECTIDKPKLCTGNGPYTISLNFNGLINKEYIPQSGSFVSFTHKTGISNKPNDYLYILNRPTLIKNFTIDGTEIDIDDKIYIKGSAIPIDRIDISTIDFHNFTIRDEQKDIFYKLAGDNNIEEITTNKLSIPELTIVNLPESKGAPINICKTKSMNKGITFKISNPNWPNSDNHFGYIIDIDIGIPDNNYRSAGYDSVWVNRDTLDKMFIGMPNDIMSTTDRFIYNETFKLRKLTYEEERLAPERYLNNVNNTFTNDDITRLNRYAPECYKGTINESDSDVERRHLMTLKNIEFVKFGDRVIKLNYEPLSEAQN